MPAGKSSLHKEWCLNSNRTHDAVTLVYAEKFAGHEQHADCSFRHDGSKAQSLGWPFGDHSEIWERYGTSG